MHLSSERTANMITCRFAFRCLLPVVSLIACGVAHAGVTLPNGDVLTCSPKLATKLGTARWCIELPRPVDDAATMVKPGWYNEIVHRWFPEGGASAAWRPYAATFPCCPVQRSPHPHTRCVQISVWLRRMGLRDEPLGERLHPCETGHYNFVSQQWSPHTEGLKIVGP
jgi:hypothetical protein